ncbi:hypothetical protein R1flu_027206 [Riccia fluitans]|uniref:Uncharacterized protein n=1 Tax=Riccia fluitans TaxID=41844 RepID=A0ABD1XI48_9MARC
MKYLGRLMNGEQDDWAQVMRFFIKQQLQKCTYCRETKYWTAEEGLLLLPSLSMPQSETTNSVLQSWMRSRRFLTLDEQELVLPGSLTRRQLQELMGRYRTRRAFNDQVVFPLLKHLGVRVLANLTDSTGKWWDIARKLNTSGIRFNQVQGEAIDIFQTWLHSVKVGAQKLEDSPSWRWKGANDTWSGWILPSRTWHKMHTVEKTPDDLSDKWPAGPYALTWRERWRKLWDRSAPPG